MNVPASLALVNPKNDTGIARWSLAWGVQQQKTWPQLRDRDKVPVQDQGDPDIGRVAASTAELGTYG
jgi:hypothetical protein